MGSGGGIGKNHPSAGIAIGELKTGAKFACKIVGLHMRISNVEDIYTFIGRVIEFFEKWFSP
jgi:hypothetical protein